MRALREIRFSVEDERFRDHAIGIGEAGRIQVWSNDVLRPFDRLVQYF